MTIKKIWFDKDHIYGEDENGKSYNQSLLWYPKLLNATDDERNQYRFGYEDAEPSRLQKFFLTHKELDIDEFAKRAGLDATQLKHYINGFKRPSEESEQQIVNSIHAIGREYITATL